MTSTVHEKLPTPLPEAVRAARKNADLTQTEAGQLVSGAGVKAYRTWQRHEAPVGRPAHRAIPEGLWELFYCEQASTLGTNWCPAETRGSLCEEA